MCCLFGLIDYKHTLTAQEKRHILTILSTECEERGKDATGIAYNVRGRMQIYKRPWPAHLMHFQIPQNTHVIMGHTRMTTQGHAKHNCNNYPFKGMAGKRVMALAHNGVLYNDLTLRVREHFPKTKIETDSYIAVQLIEQKKALNFDSLKYMAEQVEGSFTFTLLDEDDRLYIVKGDNPLCLYHYPQKGVYLYASTEAILCRALDELKLTFGTSDHIELECGDLLCIDRDGKMSRSTFDTDHMFRRWYERYIHTSIHKPAQKKAKQQSSPDLEYIEELKHFASFFGYHAGMVDTFLEEGYTTDEIEELIYSGEVYW